MKALILSSAQQCGSVSTASSRSSDVSPSHPHLVSPLGLSHNPPSSSPHHHVLSWKRALHPPLSFSPPPPPPPPPPTPPPPPPLYAHHASRAALTYVFSLHMLHALPSSPPPAPAGVFTLLLSFAISPPPLSTFLRVWRREGCCSFRFY